MDRKRLISILSAMALSLAAFSGPAIAIDTSLSTSETTSTATETVATTTEPTEITSGGDTITEPVEETTQVVEETEVLPAPEETVTAEVPGVATVTVDDDVTVETDLGTVSADPDPEEGEDPVEFDLSGDEDPAAGDDGSSDDPLAAIGDLADVDPLDAATGSKTAGDDGTTPAERPTRQQREQAGASGDAVALGTGARHHFAFARQAPAATDVAAGELSPEVAGARAATDDAELAAAPITDLDEVPMGLKIVASLLLAGAATTWWTVREALNGS